jgi:mannonate dehydratase
MVAEMLDDPAHEIFDVIRWFGEGGKIFNVHSATSRGESSTPWRRSPTRATSTWPALAAYRDVGYPYMLMPDHVPQIDGRDPSAVAFANCYGYIQVLLDALVPRR